MSHQPSTAVADGDGSATVDASELFRSMGQKLLIMAAIIAVVTAIWTSSSGPHSVDTTVGPPLVAPPAETSQTDGSQIPRFNGG